MDTLKSKMENKDKIFKQVNVADILRDLNDDGCPCSRKLRYKNDNSKIQVVNFKKIK